MLEVYQDSADQSVYFDLVDSTTGLGKTGLVYTDITARYTRTRGTSTTITMATLAAADSAHSDGGFKEVDSTNAAGLYRFDLPDACVANGAVECIVTIKATGVKTEKLRIRILKWDFQTVPTSTEMQANVTKLLGTEWLTPATAGTPDVNAKLAGGTEWNSGAITAAAIADEAIDIATFAADVGTTAYASNPLAKAILERLTSALTTVGSLGKWLADNIAQTGDSFARIGANGAGLTSLATAAQINSMLVNTRTNISVPIEIETPDSSTQSFKIYLYLYDEEGNPEAPDSTPTIALTNAAGTDRSTRLSSATNVSTGGYSWTYTATAGDTEEQLIWLFTVVEGGLNRVYPATSYVVEESAYRFSSTDRATLNSRATQASVDTIDGIVDAIVADTNELQSDWANGGRLDLLLDTLQSSINTFSINTMEVY